MTRGVKMTQEPTRRDVLKKSSALGVGVTGLATTGIPDFEFPKTLTSVVQEPSANRDTDLFRFINNGVGSDVAKVTLRDSATGQSVDTYRLETVGTNHPSLNGVPHEDRFPKVAADINSFGNVPAGVYTVEVQYGDLVGKTTVPVGEDGVFSGLRVKSYVQPDGRIKVDLVAVNPGRKL